MRKIFSFSSLITIFVGILFFGESFLFGASFKETKKEDSSFLINKQVNSSKIKTIQGRYRIENIIKNKDSFKISFKKERVNPKSLNKKKEDEVRKFFIVTKNVHFALHPKMSLELEASFLSDDSGSAKNYGGRRADNLEASSVLLNISTIEGGVPVWIMSSTKELGELETVKFLKMHVPNTDFRVF